MGKVGKVQQEENVSHPEEQKYFAKWKNGERLVGAGE